MTIGRFGMALLLSAWTCAWSTVPLAAAQAPAAPAAAGDDADHEALRQLKWIYEGAIRDNKIDALAPYFSAEIFGVMVTGRVVKNVQELKQYWADMHALMGPGGTYSTTLNPERSIVIGDVALARGTSNDVVVTSEKREYRFTSMWTAVLRKQDGRWQVVQVQGTIDPVDNAFVREFRRRALLWAIPLSALSGAAIGLGGAWLLRRRRARAA